MRARPLMLAVAVAAVAPVLAAQVYVSPSGSDVSGTGTSSNPYRTISYAAAVAVAGQTIHIGPGTYGDDDRILIGDKDLTIVGAGRGQTIVKPSPTEVLMLPTGAPPGTPDAFRVAIAIDGPARIDIRDLTIDCDFRMPASGRLVGLLFRDGADGTVENVEIRNVRADPLSASQEPVAVLVRGDDAVDPSEVRVRSCELREWGKSGLIALFNADVQVEYCTILGAGPVAAGGPAQNGVQISNGAVATLRYNLIADADYAPTTFAAAGILLFNAGAGCVIEGNRVTRCEDNIALFQQPTASVAASVRQNRSTQASVTALRIEGNEGVVATRNVLHGVDRSFSPAFDTALAGNSWQDNNYSDWSGVGSYAIPGGAISDSTPRRNCDEFSGTGMIALASAARDIVTAQLDGAGRLDVAAVTGATQPSLEVARENAGSYVVTQLPFASTAARAVAIAVGQLDGMPGLDLVAITASPPPSTAENRIWVFANNGSGAFSLLHVEPMLAGVVAPADVATGDFDGDGLDDLAIGHRGDGLIPGGAAVYRNGGGGTSWPAAALPGASRQCKAIATGRIDAGTSVDVALAEGDGSTGFVRLYANDGTGAFTELAGSPFAVGANPTALGLMDADGDGKPEVLATSWGALTAMQRGTLSILHNELPAAFTVQTVPTDTGPIALATGDLARDADPDTTRPDAIVVHGAARDLNLFGEFGAAGPAQGAVCLVGNNPSVAALADMNGDGYGDLLVADAVLSIVSIRFGRATARADLFGSGCPGANGRVPLISAAGSPAVPQQPNPTFAIRLANGRPMAPAIYMLGVPTGLLSSCSLAVNPLIVIPALTDARGAVTLPLPIPTTASLFGGALPGQWAVLDNASPFFGLVSLSQGLIFRIGF